MGTDKVRTLGTGADMGTGTGTETGAKKRRGRPRGSKSKYTVSDKAIMQRRKNANVIPYDGEDKDYNARHIEHILRIQEIASHADVSDPVSLRSCFINYLMLCQQDGFKIGNIGAAASMGVAVYTVDRWLTQDRPEYRELATFVKTTCSLAREGMIADQKINPVIGIFWQRNYDGLRNDTEQQQLLQQQETDTTETKASDYLKKYGELAED